MKNPTPFTVLKKQRFDISYGIPDGTGVGLRGSFQLRSDPYGWYLVTCDLQNHDIFMHEHNFQGPVQKALSLYNRVSRSASWEIEWGKEAGRVYIGDFPDLVESVLACPGFLTLGPDGEALQFDPRQGNLMLRMTDADDGVLESRVLFKPHQKDPVSDFVFLTPSLVLAGYTIYRIDATVQHQDLYLFTSKIQTSEAEKVISLFASTFSESEIQYLDYLCSTVPVKESVDTAESAPVSASAPGTGRIALQPTLIFESVDDTGVLYLNTAVSAKGADVDFLNDYDLLYLAFLDHERRILHLNRIIPCDLEEAVTGVTRALRRLQDKNNPLKTYHRVDDLFIIQPELAVSFLEQELHTVLSDFVLLGTKELTKFKINMVKPVINLRVGSGIDFLEGSAEVEVNGENFTLSEFFAQFDANRYILLNDGTKAVVENKLIMRMKRLLQPDEKGNIKISFFDLPMVSELIDEKTAAQGFLESRKILEGFNTISASQPAPPELTAVLRDYQKHGFAWLHYLKTHQLGGCLADDMGLGKTIQTIALLATMYPGDKQPSLIIMPNSILLNWKNEIERFAPQIRAVVYHGAKRELHVCMQHDLILTTYATVRNDIQVLKKENFTYIVLDESQRIKNIDSQISKAVMLLSSRYRLALSGTPIENNLSELYALYRFLNPAMFGKKSRFQRDYGDPIAKNGDAGAAEDLKLKIYPFMLRRLKTEVLKELPEKTEQIISVEMSPAQTMLYERRRQYYLEEIKRQMAKLGFMKARFILLTAMNELRQIASIPENKSDGSVRSPKIEVLCEYLEETIGNGHKALVFANFLGAIDRIGEELDKRHITFLEMTGATRNRSAVVESFQNSDSFQVLLMTLKTGGVGLNLTAADYVYIFDPWWNAAAENQAIDRVHRIGQKNSVFSYKLITQGTIEEKILQLQQNKLELVESLIESDSQSSRNGEKMLREEDIDFIFSSSRR